MLKGGSIPLMWLTGAAAAVPEWEIVPARRYFCETRHLPDRQNSLTDSVDTEGVHLENVRPSGGVPEWPKGSDCKSDARASVVRIHPPPPRITPEGGVRTFGAGRGSRGESDAAGIV